MIHPVEELSAYLDGALTASEQERIAQHLAGCAECRVERDRLERAVRVLKRLAPAPALSPHFEQRFYARLAAEKQSRRRGLGERLGWRWTGTWRWLAPSLTGAVAAAAVLVYAGGRHRVDETFLASHLDLFESYEEVASLDTIDGPEDVQVVAHLKELRGQR